MTGLSHQTAPVDVREQIAFTAPGQQAEVLQCLARELAPAEVVLLSTCNRTEVYVAGTDATGEQVRDLLRGIHAGHATSIDNAYFVEHRCGAAATHLFRVTAGLESMVLGETDIVRQVRDSYALAAANGTTGPRLDALFHEALRVAKRARSEMDVSRGVFSVGGAAADLAGSIFGDLSGRSILLLGAGKMSETTARHLTASGANTVLVANRTRDRAVRLAETLGGRAVPFEELDRHLAIADIVIASTAAPHCILTAERLAPVMRQRRGRDLFLIDIALPRDIEPACGRIDGVFLYDLDDLQRVVDVESSERGLRARAASLLVEREAEQFLGKVLSAAIATPMVTEFRNKHREIVDDELARLRRRLPGVSEEEWAAIEAFAGSVLNRIAHDPTVRIREYAQARDANRLDTARELLGLGESSGNTKS